MTHATSRRRALRALISLAFAPAAALLAAPTHAHGGAAEASAASSLSLSLPVAVLSAAPVMILSAGAMLTVVAVEASAAGTVWLLRRASDGATASLRFSGEAAAASLVVAGTALSVTAIAAGWLLSVAGEVICLVPNDWRGLLHLHCRRRVVFVLVVRMPAEHCQQCKESDHIADRNHPAVAQPLADRLGLGKQVRHRDAG